MSKVKQEWREPIDLPQTLHIRVAEGVTVGPELPRVDLGAARLGEAVRCRCCTDETCE